MTIDIALENKKFADLNPIICGRQECGSGHSYGPAIRKYYLIHYVESGKGLFLVDGKDYQVEAGECFIIKPNQIVKYTADKDEPWSYIWIGFDGNLAGKIEKFKKPVISLNTPVIFKEMMNANDYSGAKEEYLAGKLFILFSELFSEPKKYENYIEVVKNYIQTGYMNKIKIGDIAQAINLDRHYLSRIFKQKTGISAQEFLMGTRMTEAKRLLQKDRSVTETCYMVGYDDVFTFSKAYKNYCGMSPSETKKRSPKRGG
jgi:AraC-like DNA-binding protein